MNITKFSRSRLQLSASRWTVPRDYFEPLYNYLVHGFEPGSFWTAVLANDFMRAVQCSHPSNTIEALKHCVGWIQDSFPRESYGNIYMVEDWIQYDPSYRRQLLESSGLIYTEQQEIMLVLKGQQPADTEHILW
jgi:hypothetical protein